MRIKLPQPPEFEQGSATKRMRRGRRRSSFVLVHGRRSRSGAASIDYVLVLAVILPLATFLFFVVPRMIQLVYEMTITMIGSPLM